MSELGLSQIPEDPKAKELSDLRLTVESAITNAFAETAHITGLRSGPTTDQLRAAIMKWLFDSPYYWVMMKGTYGEPKRPETQRPADQGMVDEAKADRL